MIDVLAFELTEAEALLKKHNINFICIETKAPFVYNYYVPTAEYFVVKQLSDEVGGYILYISQKFLKGGA